MRKLFIPRELKALFYSQLFFIVLSSFAWGDDRFALAVGSHDMLVVFGPKGEKVAEVPAPSISQPVTIGTTTFQVSYGRDANDLLTAILTPSPSQPQDLHFNVLNKTVDTDKQAVVTLTFSQAGNRVSVDPGYIGLVHVDSHTIKHRELAEEQYAPAPRYSQTSATTRTTVRMTPRSAEDMAPAASYSPVDPMPTADAVPAPSSDISGVAANLPPTENKRPLFWSEPVTPPGGSPPHVGINEMKLVEVQGSVSIKMADGSVRQGDEGMLLPSGSTVVTSEASSAAVFMGGVNSVRLLPASDAQFVQHLNGSLRKTSIDLHQGTVFSRVGRRPNETQDYEVRTPEGVAAARGTEFADFRGTYEDLHSTHANARVQETNRLLAWNPTPLSHGLMSDITNPLMAAAGGVFHFVFVANGTVELFMDGKLFKTLTGVHGHVSSGEMPATENSDKVLHEILLILQPFNLKLQGVLDRIDNGTATEDDIAYYNNIKDTYTDDTGDGDNDNGGIAPPLIPPPPFGPPPATGTLNVDVDQFKNPDVTPF